MGNIDLFIGHFVDVETNELPNGVSFAGNNYQNKVRSILNINRAISIFYGVKNKIYVSNNELNNTILKHGRHIFNLVSILKNLFKLNPKENKTILLYNLNIYSLIYFLYFSLFTKARVVIILADAGFLLEKSVKSQILKKALSYSYGILTLREIFAIRNYKCKIEIMPGIILKEFLYIESHKVANTVLLSGSLGITTGLLLALDFFYNQLHFKLIITGVPYLMSNSDLEKILEKYKCQYIKFLGVLDYKDYLTVLNYCEFGLSLRNPKDLEHQLNFPSKIIEYMSCGNIVISSLYYPEIFEDLYYRTEFSSKGIIDCFERILITSEKDRKLLSLNAYNFVKENCSEEVLINKIHNLFE